MTGIRDRDSCDRNLRLPGPRSRTGHWNSSGSGTTRNRVRKHVTPTSTGDGVPLTLRHSSTKISRPATLLRRQRLGYDVHPSLCTEPGFTGSLCSGRESLRVKVWILYPSNRHYVRLHDPKITSIEQGFKLDQVDKRHTVTRSLNWRDLESKVRTFARYKWRTLESPEGNR